MPAKEVTISVNDDGNFNYSFAVLHVSPGEQVKWFSAVGHFVVSFYESPFDVAEIHGTQNVWTDPKTVRSDVEPGVYHYAVAVGKGNKVHINSGCPELVIP